MPKAVGRHFFPFAGAQEFLVYLPTRNDVWGDAPLYNNDWGVSPDYTIKGYLHILEPREGADARPHNNRASVESGGIYVSAEFTTRYDMPTLPIGAGIIESTDERKRMFIIQNYVKQETNPFTGWKPTKKYLVAWWAG